jgi:hypothetical protein
LIALRRSGFAVETAFLAENARGMASLFFEFATLPDHCGCATSCKLSFIAALLLVDEGG